LSAQSEDRPAVLRVINMGTGEESGALTDAQVDEIVRFVKTIPGINHHVNELDGTSPPQVVVHTGSYLSGRGHGDLLRIEKRNGRWSLLSKSKWKFANRVEEQY
jgi:hypothetical protein